MRKPLDKEEISTSLKALPGWEYRNDRLSKEFKFASFKEAIAFVVRLSFEAEALDHHPEISNVYNKVGIELTTHDAGNRVTKMDVDLATAIESITRK